MEAFLIALMLVIACVVVGIGAKNGAERELRRREERWGRVPVSDVHRAWEGAAAGSATLPRGPAPGRPMSPVASTSAAGAAEAPPRRAPAPRGPVRRAAPAERATIVERPRPRPRPAPQVNINEAGLEELRNLPGVGVRAAERIVAHRDRHGPFDSVQGLEAVEGFDAHRIGRLAPSATV